MWLFCNLFQESLLPLNSRDWNFCHILTLRYWPQFNLDNEWQLARKQLVLPLLGVLFLYCLICRTGINMTEIALTTSKSSPHNYICIMPLIIATVPQEQTILVFLWNLWLCASIHLSSTTTLMGLWELLETISASIPCVPWLLWWES